MLWMLEMTENLEYQSQSKMLLYSAETQLIMVLYVDLKPAIRTYNTRISLFLKHLTDISMFPSTVRKSRREHGARRPSPQYFRMGADRSCGETVSACPLRVLRACTGGERATAGRALLPRAAAAVPQSHCRLRRHRTAAARHQLHVIGW